jgi:hypothetical protein
MLRLWAVATGQPTRPPESNREVGCGIHRERDRILSCSTTARCGSGTYVGDKEIS